MSTLTTTVPTRGDVLPGYTLSEPSVFAHDEIERHLNDRHARHLLAAAGGDPALLDPVLESVSRILSRRPFAAGTAAYEDRLVTDVSLTPALLRACLLRHHPAVSLHTAEKLIDEGNLDAVRSACLGLFGYERAASKKAQAAETAGPSTSSPSTGASAAAASTSTPSDA